MPEMNDQPESIGMATMDRDGTIVLLLRADDGAGTIGDTRLVYSRSDSHYQEILDHLDGLRPGEKKAVPPWPDSTSPKRATK
jgi:hypothetical protein